ncbi:MAG: phenylalanine--tRNA ligase subunit alpha [Christensenellales bacterium]
MLDALNRVEKEVEKALKKVNDLDALEALRLKVLGKKGSLTQLLRGMGALSPEERPSMGKRVNDVRLRLEESLRCREEILTKAEKDARLLKETLDISIPGKDPCVGKLHPMTQVRRRIEEIFIGMGFEIAEGPEVETDYYNFELMNIPKNHPARDMQDSLFLSENLLLRTHTSPVQGRVMTTQKPPIRIICPGRVYRNDQVDATHSPVFHQIEGLVVDKGINMGHLKGTLDAFAREMYGDHVRTRFRPSFFPFTEPSAEVDISCYLCGGNEPNCRICHGTGWLEILGCGMVNPHVLEMCGINPEIYSGFAFGLGWDRITTVKYSISDLRLLTENDLRFLNQF